MMAAIFPPEEYFATEAYPTISPKPSNFSLSFANQHSSAALTSNFDGHASCASNSSLKHIAGHNMSMNDN